VITAAKKFTFVAFVSVGFILASSFTLQPSQALTNGGSITALGVPLTESFDTLASVNTAITWTDNVTIPGVYSTRATYNAGTGSSNAGALYSFGVAGAGAVADRALGSVGSGSTGTIYWGVKLANNTGATITSLTVNYNGEQWRNGGATSPAVALAQTVEFQYQVANAGTITSVNSPATGWVDHNALDFTSPTFGTSTATALDGNAAANRTAKSSTITVSIAPGQEVWLRWVDVDHAGNDHGLAIDDLEMTAGGAPVDAAPTVTTTSPANGDTNVAVNSAIAVNFSESVNATTSAFTIQCPIATPIAFSQSSTPAASVTLTPTAALPYGTVCTVTAVANQITDEDTDDPADQMSSNFVFSFTTVPPPVDPAPTVVSTMPANNGTGVAVGSNIVINFSEGVTAAPGAFAVSCGSVQSFTLSGSPGASLTLNPDSDLPYSTACTVNITGSQISDVDSNDPDDQMAGDVSFSFITADPPLPGADVIINEIDADTPGNDAAEFVELFDGGAGNTSLTGLTVVFFQGEDDKAYAVFSLDGYSTDANGYFTLGNPAVPGVDLVFAPGQFGLLQNGADAVALYASSATNFPIGAPVTTANLQDAIVYGTDDPDDAQLLPLLNPGQEQVNESAAGAQTTQSNSRCENGSGGARNTSTYRQSVPTPGGENNLCPPPPPAPGSSQVVISQVYGGGGNANATYRNDFVELFNRGSQTVDVTGWSLQYASATGSGWDFNKQPLAGTIAPGEYYLVSLASGGAIGTPLPAANVTGGLINMAAASGKIALLDNFDALTGTCPRFSVHLKDLVGYGTANCREGLATAPQGSNTTSLLRKNGGAIDTDQNGSDFLTGTPTPRQTAPIVELGPYVLSTDPASNGTDAPRDATIQVTFTEAVDVVDPWFAISCATTGVHDSFTQAGSGQSHYITPNVNFAPGEQCTVTVFKDQVHDQDTDDSGVGADTMTADHIWTFVVATGTAPPYPASVHLAMGNPTGAAADVGQPNNFLMAKPEFAASYDRDLGRPNWVSWHLSDEWFGTLTRVDTFRADPAIPPDWYRVQSFDFSGSGFDRGHMVPNADRDKETSVPINQATFLMSNMVAQAPDNNQGPWAQFEEYLRALAGTTNEIYIVAGPTGIGGTGSNGGVTATVANGHVTVPERTWKVALVLSKAPGDDLARVSCETRTIAINMPNVQGIRNDPWENYLTTVDAIEALTGYDLFSSLPLAIQACVEAGTNGNNPPLDTTPPSVTCDAADGSWHPGNVGLGCTATDVDSGLVDPSDAAFQLSTSVADNVETANASTASLVVCDVAGNCVTAGPIAGNKIDRKAPSITLATPIDGGVYQLNKVVTASFSCNDGGSGNASCAGTVVNGAAIDTTAIGTKSFAVTATDSVGNVASRIVSYTVAVNGISISNIPEDPRADSSFIAAFNYAGDGTTSVTSSTPTRCSVSAGTVTLIHPGRCTLVPHATGTANFDAVDGVPESFIIMPVAAGGRR
jgi:endonuclease G